MSATVSADEGKIPAERLHLAAPLLRQASAWAVVLAICFALVIAALAVSFTVRRQSDDTLRTDPFDLPWWFYLLMCSYMLSVYLSGTAMMMLTYLTRAALRRLRATPLHWRPWSARRTAVLFIVTVPWAPITLFLCPFLIGLAARPCRSIADDLREGALTSALRGYARDCRIARWCWPALFFAIGMFAAENNPVWLMVVGLTLASLVRLAVQLALLLRRTARAAAAG